MHVRYLKYQQLKYSVPATTPFQIQPIRNEHTSYSKRLLFQYFLIWLEMKYSVLSNMVFKTCFRTYTSVKLGLQGILLNLLKVLTKFGMLSKNLLFKLLGKAWSSKRAFKLCLQGTCKAWSSKCAFKNGLQGACKTWNSTVLSLHDVQPR